MMSFTFINKNIIFTAIFISFFLVQLPSSSFDLTSSAFSLNADIKTEDLLSDTQKIEKLLSNYEADWNKHDKDKIASYYSDAFINGDGLTFPQVHMLTQELWGAYPDIKTKSQEKTIRVYGDYATVNSVDIYQGTSKGERNDVGSKGFLKAVSIGEVFLKKFGKAWKITSDRTIFERVSIGYGIGNELVDTNKIILSAPEQVVSGQDYTASISFELPNDIKPIGAVSKEVLIYPQISTEDKFRIVEGGNLERLFTANMIYKNELISATVGLTGGPAQPKLLGLVFLTRRVNVVPVSGEIAEEEIITESARSALNKSVEIINEKVDQNSSNKEIINGKSNHKTNPVFKEE